MRIIRKALAIIPGMLLLAVALIACQPGYENSPTGADLAPTATNPPGDANYPNVGGIGSTLLLPDGSMAITLLNVEQHGSQVLFQFRVKNQTGHPFAPIGTETDYQFIVPRLHTRDGSFIQATHPSQADLSTHPMLPALLSEQAQADGWVAIDTTVLGETPQQIEYRFATVHTFKCTNPQDQSTCQPADIGRALLWNFQL